MTSSANSVVSAVGLAWPVAGLPRRPARVFEGHVEALGVLGRALGTRGGAVVTQAVYGLGGVEVRLYLLDARLAHVKPCPDGPDRRSPACCYFPGELLRRLRDALGDQQDVPQVQGQVPAWVMGGGARRADFRRALAQFLQLRQASQA
jgi:hypothetical protein